MGGLGWWFGGVEALVLEEDKGVALEAPNQQPKPPTQGKLADAPSML